jgi:hypothetical protein
MQKPTCLNFSRNKKYKKEHPTRKSTIKERKKPTINPKLHKRSTVVFMPIADL